MAIPMPVPIQHTRPRSRHESKTKAMEATLLIRTTGEGVSQVDRGRVRRGLCIPMGRGGRPERGKGERGPSFGFPQFLRRRAGLTFYAAVCTESDWGRLDCFAEKWP